jgi:hypothetical protein
MSGKFKPGVDMHAGTDTYHLLFLVPDQYP